MSNLRPMVLLLTVVLAVLVSAAPAAMEEADSQVCEKAFYVCFTWPGHNLPWDVVECLAGYSYCKKYVEPLLGLPG
ncbi:MAG: hypothetical protein NTZ26_12845 [Candidatus Aminicenantes bacterium]|nr:hypothetical protein [Candidatus Aminicenantes bacterium]